MAARRSSSSARCAHDPASRPSASPPDCRYPPLPPSGCYERAPYRLPPRDTKASSCRQTAPDESSAFLNSYPSIILNLPLKGQTGCNRNLTPKGHTGRHHLCQALAQEPAATPRQTLHHLAHLRVLLQQIVHFLNRCPAAFGDALAPLAVDDHVIGALFRRHRVHDRHQPVDLVLVHLDVLQVLHHADLRHHTQQRFERPQLADLLHLIAE